MAIHDGVRELGEFLTLSFTREELERIAFRSDPNGKLVAALPGPSATLSHVAHAFVAALVARGLLDRSLFSILCDERPRRADEIQIVMQKCLAAREASNRGRTAAEALPADQATILPWWATVALLTGITLLIGLIIQKIYAVDLPVHEVAPAQIGGPAQAVPEEQDGILGEKSHPLTVDVLEAEKDALSASLEASSDVNKNQISVRVETNPVGVLTVDGDVSGKTPVRMSLSAGRHRFKITAPNCRDRHEVVDVESEGQKKFRWVLKCGSNNVHVREQAEDGELDPEVDGVPLKIMREVIVDSPVMNNPTSAPW